MSWLDAQSRSAWHTAHADGRVVVLCLPYPPTINHAHRSAIRTHKRTGKQYAGRYVTADARAYAEEVWWLARAGGGLRQLPGPIVMLICATPPDNLRRDVANLEKVLTDAIVDAGVMLDDRQVRDTRLAWAHSAYSEQMAQSGVEVSIRELLPAEMGIAPPPAAAPRKRRNSRGIAIDRMTAL